MTPTIVLPDGDPHMAALLSRPDFAARLDRLGGARLHADLPKDDDELITRIGDATVVILVGHYGDAAVAEHALALTLALAKHVVGNDRAERAGEWHVGQGTELAGKTAGIVGYGGIGARFAVLLEAIGMRVVAWTPHPGPARLTSQAQRFVELQDLLAVADVVSLHLLLADDTRGMIDERLLRSLTSSRPSRSRPIHRYAICPTWCSPRTRATTPRRAWSACSTWSSPTSSATCQASPPTSSPSPDRVRYYHD
jgi:hypothetical protein